ncbi:uncharacterized protein LOC110734163 [Chenopodium quinoa]|uniref:uncharacterized protein LOC110734163 n=1 Tax=Chenopodium quinoa TaxID=63459 RepID=UPI000B788B36|nr:uncharacterized protein LOC110734163 [Chenopodium quinoa]
MQLDLSGAFHTPGNGKKGSNNRDISLDEGFIDVGTFQNSKQTRTEEGKIEKVVKEYLKAFEAKITKIPGVSKPMEGRKSCRWLHRIAFLRRDRYGGHAKKEVDYLLKKGYLKELMTDRSKASGRERKYNQGGPPPLPPIIKTINFISGGSEMCGLTYSAAKRNAKEKNMNKPTKKVQAKLDLSIVFEESDAMEEHHDGLVISLPVGNCLIKRILVDNGSSANIIILDTVKHMNINEKDIIKKSTMLVGFSGETKKTIGEITLPTYAKGINLQVKFLVINTLSSYNIVLCRPWMHEMKAIPSTYNQIIKFPTKWGIQEIKGDPKEAKECYKIALKAISAEKESA